MWIFDANLDAEARWAGGALPKQIAERVSPLAALCAALAPDGVAPSEIEIWAPAAVDPARLAGWPGKAPAMRAGTPPRADARWAQDRARDVNDRNFALALAGELGCALPGARAIASLDELAAHLAAGGAAASPTRGWVCKAPLTTAGRDRVFGTGDAIPGDARALLASHGALVFEPWLDRTLDAATCGTVTARGAIELLPSHRLLSSPRGAFRGIDLDFHDDQLAPVAARAGEALARAGYVGPFGVDAFRYRTGGGERWHPLCEINARYTFGHVAHALARTLGARSLHVGPRSALPPAGADARILVTPAPLGAWLLR